MIGGYLNNPSCCQKLKLKMKRKTNFKLMYLVDTNLFNKVNNVNPSGENRLWVKNVVNTKQPFHNFESQLEPMKTEIQPGTDFSMQTRTPQMTNAVTETDMIARKNKRIGTDNPLIPERMDVDTDEQCMECDDSLPLPAPPQIQALPSPPTTKMIQLQAPLLPIAGPSHIQPLQTQYHSSFQPLTQEVLPQAHRMVQYQPPFPQQTLSQPPRLEMIQPPSPQLALPPPTTQPVLQHQSQLPLPSPSPFPNTQLSRPQQSTEVVHNQYKNYYEYSKFICTLCNTDFGTKKILQRHMKNIHDAYEQKKRGNKHGQTFTCDICYNEFKSQKVLDRHVNNIHDAFSQEKKGLKRKNRRVNSTPHKYVKFI